MFQSTTLVQCSPCLAQPSVETLDPSYVRRTSCTTHPHPPLAPSTNNWLLHPPHSPPHPNPPLLVSTSTVAAAQTLRAPPYPCFIIPTLSTSYPLTAPHRPDANAAASIISRTQPTMVTTFRSKSSVLSLVSGFTISGLGARGSGSHHRGIGRVYKNMTTKRPTLGSKPRVDLVLHPFPWRPLIGGGWEVHYDIPHRDAHRP